MKLYSDLLKEGFQKAIAKVYDQEIDQNKIGINSTRKEFEGDYTLVLFPFLKELKTNPVALGDAVGKYLVENYNEISDYNTVKGFLNISFSQQYWKEIVDSIHLQPDYGKWNQTGEKVIVEFSSPNTNKPLHLGHVRNILLGWSCAKILEAAGQEVVKVQIINDRGIAICKSMLAWQEYGNGANPVSTGLKSDHFVGEYYVLFEQKFKEEYTEWQKSEEGKLNFELLANENESPDAFYKRYKNEYFNKFSILGKKAKSMLLEWEAGEESVRRLWEKMNAWVYEGFEETYKALQVEFDQLYYESETYLLGKKAIDFGLEKQLFYKAEDGSVWIDLEDAGYDQKILLRSDGTSVYMTQDLGTAMQRYEDHHPDSMVYVVADEQDYHFQVLFEILKRLDQPYADKLHHLSYGMVELPDGKMKSREGTVVDADDLITEVINEARLAAMERGELPGETEEEKNEILRNIALGAIKFFILKVTPNKRMIFNPAESLDMQGQTGPYIQNAYVRIKSILRRVEGESYNLTYGYNISNEEIELIKQLCEYPAIIKESAEKYDPSDLANYNYQLAKSFHKFYHDFRIIGAESEDAKKFRLVLIENIAKVLKSGMRLLGIEMPERM